MPSTQTLHLGTHAAAVEVGLEQLRRQRALPRLWEKDASLWSSDPTVQASIRNRLGWLAIPQVMAREVPAMRQFAQEVRQAGFTRAVLLGMGGSGLFTEVCRQTFGVARNGLDVVVLDTTDPTAILAEQRRGPLQQLLAIVSSKSGSTSEVAALSKYFYDAFKLADRNPGAHCVAITDAGTSLETQAAAWKFRRTFVHGSGNGSDVGGRFSALTYFGLVPAALMGVEIDRVLERAIGMLTRCGPSVPLEEHPAAQLGALLGALADAGRDKMTLLCSPAMASIGTWVDQLVAESTGKSGKGIAPLFGEPLRDPAAYVPDRVFVELQIASQVDGAIERHVLALIKAGHPVVRIAWDDRYDLGAEVIRWAIATTLAASLMGINPFDEPNVQESKDLTKALLGRYVRNGRFDGESPFLTDGDVALYGTPASGVSGSLSEVLAAFLNQRRPREYVAVLSFLPRTAALDQAAREIRHRLATGLGAATLLGFGPRYLHSTGQLFKGGPDAGLFLLLTADDGVDLPIPGEAFTFGVLKQAQALGDFQAMQGRGRRILRLHLRGDVERAAQRVLLVIDEMVRGVAP